MVRNIYKVLTCFVLFFAYEYRRVSLLDDVYPEIGYSIEELVKSWGYNFEEHTVVTEDGYILKLHRLSSQKLKEWRKPIFLMHGVACNSINWLSSTDKSLPIFLANEGFDVWLGNARGNSYSRHHKNIDPNTKPEKFFNFSWHEIGAFDLPAMIDHVLKETHFEKLYYVGHSQGSIVFHVMMSEKPEYNQKVELMIGLSPVIYISGVSSFVYNLSPTTQDYVKWFMNKIGKYEIAPQRPIARVVGNAYCRDGSWLQSLCYYPLGIFGGFNIPAINSTLLPFMFTHFGAGAAIKQIYHYMQLANTNSFQKYDYGREENRLKYGQDEPPLYYLNRTTVPVALFWSLSDIYITEKNIKRLEEELPNVVLNHKIVKDEFSHIDYLASFTAEDLLYPYLIKVIAKQENKKH